MGSIPVVNILMDPVQVPYPSLEVQRHQQHGRTPLEVEACVLMSASDDNEQNMTQTAAPDDRVIAVPVPGRVVQSQTHDPQLEDSVSGGKVVDTTVACQVIC